MPEVPQHRVGQDADRPVTTAGSIRSATDHDLPELRSIAREAFIRERVDPAGIVDLLHRRPGVPSALRLVATSGGRIAGFCYASVRDGSGHLDGLAVARPFRQHGVATALVREASARLAGLDCRSVRTGGTYWYYAWPGVDRDYDAAVQALRRLGFQQVSVERNMDVDLTGWVPGRASSASSRRVESPLTVRRARAADGPALHELITAHFDEVWGPELDLVLRRSVPPAYVAERDDRLVGFAAHGVYRPDLFGPLGVEPAERGSGAGRALLLACLDEMAATGMERAQISWIGPAEFYAKAVNARIGRTFLVFEKPLGAAVTRSDLGAVIG